MSSLSGEAIETIVERFAGKGYGEFKSAVADVVCAEPGKNSARYNEIINSTLIEETLAEGAVKAQRLASRKRKRSSAKSVLSSANDKRTASAVRSLG